MASNMTDNEIIKALECCSNNVLYEQCVNCPYEKYLEKGHTCIIKATKNALDLINRQNAEIERLNNTFILARDSGKSIIQLNIEKIKAEAVKEFAERLHGKAKARRVGDIFVYGITLDDINETKKEMVGDV